MSRQISLYYLIAMIIIFSLSACTLPGQTSADDAITYAKGTLSAEMTLEASVSQTIAAISPPTTQPSNTLPPTATATIEPATEQTSTPEQTATISETVTPSSAVVRVVMDTNCRTGPGVVYPYIGALMVGEQAEMVGRLNTNTYWVIKNLDAAGTCWITAQYATPEGPYNLLPVMTPPPTPSPTPYPDFTVNFSTTALCGADRYFTFFAKNTGTSTFKSAYIEMKNQSLSTTVTNAGNNLFWGVAASCGGTTQMIPGSSYFLPVMDNTTLPGNSMTAVIKLCTDINLGGQCISRNLIFFSPP